MERNLTNLNNNEYLKDKKKIFLYDRGYPSIEFFEKMMNNSQKFVYEIENNKLQKRKRCNAHK
jgi:hypothetical protein